MANNDTYAVGQQGLADGSDFVLDGSEADTGAAQVVELGATGSAELYREVDIDGDGTFEVSVLADSFSNLWHTQDNTWRVSQSQNVRLVITNTSGGAIDPFGSGFEVDD